MSPPPKIILGLFSLKKAFHEEKNFCEDICGGRGDGCFTWGLMIRSCNEGGKISKMHFPVIWTVLI